MANEISISVNLSVRKLDSTNTITLVNYQGASSFQPSMAGSSGPYIGVIAAGQTTTNVPLSAVGGGGGIAKFTNQSGTNSIEVGLYDASRNKFLPFMLLLPGESYLFRLSNHVGAEEPVGTGTGTAGTGVVSLALKGNAATVPVLVEVFPK